MGAFTAINPDHRFSDSLPWPHCSLTCHHCLNQSTLCVCVFVFDSECESVWMKMTVLDLLTTEQGPAPLLMSPVCFWCLLFSTFTGAIWLLLADRLTGFVLVFFVVVVVFWGEDRPSPPHLLFTGWTIHPPCLKASFPSFYSGGYAITQTNTLCQTNSPDFRLIFTYLFHTLNCWSLQSLALARSHMVIYIYHVHTYTHKQTYLIASLQT